MAEQLGHDAHFEEKLSPSFPLGCRRMLPCADYLQSLAKPNAHVVTIRMTKDSVVDESGNEHKDDIVICANGLDVAFVPHFEIIG